MSDINHIPWGTNEDCKVEELHTWEHCSEHGHDFCIWCDAQVPCREARHG